MVPLLTCTPTTCFFVTCSQGELTTLCGFALIAELQVSTPSIGWQTCELSRQLADQPSAVSLALHSILFKGYGHQLSHVGESPTPSSLMSMCWCLCIEHPDPYNPAKKSSSARHHMRKQQHAPVGSSLQCQMCGTDNTLHSPHLCTVYR